MYYNLIENDDVGLFYLYELIDPVEMKPFYVGKGKLNRYKDHFNFNDKKNRNNHKINKIKKIISNGHIVIIKIIFRSNDEYLVLEKEKELIMTYGRIDNNTGILTNLTNGGDGVSGFKPSNELKKKWSDIRKGHNNGMYNKNHSDESINKMKSTKLEKYKTGEIKPTKHSEEWKKKLRDDNPNGKKLDTDTINKILELNDYGYSLPEISKRTNVTIGVIKRRLLKYNIQIKFCKNKIDIDEILLKINEGYSKLDICYEYNVSISTINQKIRKFNKKELNL